MRLFARTLRRLWARPLKASCGHGMDAFTEGGATRTRPLISCQHLCAWAPLLLLIVPAILATSFSSSTSSSTSSCSSYRSRLSAMQMSRCSICDHNNNNNNRSCLRLLLWHSLKVIASSVPAVLSAFSLSLLFLSLSCAFAVVFYITAMFWIATKAVAFSTYLNRSSHSELRSV